MLRRIWFQMFELLRLEIHLSVERMEVLIMNIMRRRDSIKSYEQFSSSIELFYLFIHRIYYHMYDKLLNAIYFTTQSTT